jgi:hypothetical protein
VCEGNTATAVSGIVVTTPYFAHGKTRDGIELSHTIFDVKTNQEAIYQVAVDNVYANDYDENPQGIPYSLAATLLPGTHIDICGELYTDGRLGIHWVHTNCGNYQNGPNGYLIINGHLLTASQEYCKLFAN